MVDMFHPPQALYKRSTTRAIDRAVNALRSEIGPVKPDYVTKCGAMTKIWLFSGRRTLRKAEGVDVAISLKDRRY